MTTLASAITDYLAGEHRPLHIDTLISEFQRLSKVAPEAYPKASADEILAAVRQLVDAGNVSMVGERVAFVRRAQVKQDGMLF